MNQEQFFLHFRAFMEANNVPAEQIDELIKQIMETPIEGQEQPVAPANQPAQKVTSANIMERLTDELRGAPNR